MRRKLIRILLLALCLGLLPLAGALAEPTVNIERQSRFGSFVDLPSISGMDNQFVQDSINRAILGLGGLDQYVSTLSGLTDEQASGLKVRASAALLPETDQPRLLAISIEAEGRIGPGRPGHRVTPMVFSLASGQQLSKSDIFTDPFVATETLNQLIEEKLMPEISSYGDASGLLPIPLNAFLLDEAGISFYYAPDQLTLLSGKSGAVNFHYDELAPWLKLGEDDVLAQIAVPQLLSAGPLTEESIAEYLSQGRLPGIPVQLGDELGTVLEDYPLLMDSEGFPGGSKYLLEDARFRGTALIEEAGNSGKIAGILSQRVNLSGIITGKTQRDEVLSLLGQPASTLALDDNTAASYGLLAGQMDSYAQAGHALEMIYDQAGLLQAVWLRTEL